MYIIIFTLQSLKHLTSLVKLFFNPLLNHQLKCIVYFIIIIKRKIHNNFLYRSLIQ